jgi:GT2 family glycosyltransferase
VSGLSIVIVSWNTRPLTLGCVAAAREAARGFSAATGELASWLLVDNGSTDGTVEAVAALVPETAIVALPRNVGFAAGANAGLARAHGDVALLLNSDARVDADALIRCWRHLEAHPRTGIVGPQLLHEDGRLQNSAHAFPSWLDAALPGWMLDALLPGRRPAKHTVGATPRAVDAVQGAALFVRRAVLEAVGPLDEGYFFYLEETDLCWRARRAGFAVELVPSARVVHAAGSSSKRVDPAASRIEFHRSLYRFLRLRRGPFVARLAVAARVFQGVLAVATLLVVAPFSARARVRCVERWHLLRWHLHGCPDHPRIGDPRPRPRAARVEVGADRRDSPPSGGPADGALPR